MLKYLYFFSLIFLLSCNTSKKADNNNNEGKVQIEQTDPSNITKEKNTSSIKTISAPIIMKNFYSKKGEMTDIKEYYVQQSVQDYFIKFCESDITSKELKEALDQQEDMIKTLTLRVEIKEGLWDQCEDYEVQSRMGKYMVIYEIIE